MAHLARAPRVACYLLRATGAPRVTKNGAPLVAFFLLVRHSILRTQGAQNRYHSYYLGNLEGEKLVGFQQQFLDAIHPYLAHQRRKEKQVPGRGYEASGNS